jgi:hypothetical protein
MIKYPVLLFLSLLVATGLFAQTGQLPINRVDMMPDLPTPLKLKDWKQTAVKYDQLVFNQTISGEGLPLVSFGETGAFNYPDVTPVYLDTYVRTKWHHQQAEAINILPAVVGASLVGVDKLNQDGTNWVSPMKDFFNKKNGQEVYLNGYSTTSGGDWWYDVMPNIYFYQLNSLYPNAASEFDYQFTRIADRWLEAVTLLGGSSSPWTYPNMHYRAFNLATGKPLTSGVAEPESAGSIAWLLYQAYLVKGDRSYYEGARLALDFLVNEPANPSYELQLPYGAYIAARINAETGSNYPIDKLLNWCFDRGPLRGWGAINGSWNGNDVSGLIGEANDAGDDYAFVMNGFQQAAALAPIPKYDKRFAKAIAKWILNVSNASRLFYRDEIPQDHQDSYEWSLQYDNEAVIPYESLKEVWNGKSLFARGDAIQGGWAYTNLSLYSGSSVGYLAAVINKTNVPEILQIDLNKTDFYGDKTYSSYLYFNPLNQLKSITLSLPSGNWDVYDAITEKIINPNVSLTTSIDIPAYEVRQITLIPAGATLTARKGKLILNDHVIDHHYGYTFGGNLNIKGFSVSQNPAIAGTEVTAWCTADGMTGTETFTWTLDGLTIGTGAVISFKAPVQTGSFKLQCIVANQDMIVSDSIDLSVVDFIAQPPDIGQIIYDNRIVDPLGETTVKIEPILQVNEQLTVLWECSSGELVGENDLVKTWKAPQEEGVYIVTVTATNQWNLTTVISLTFLVRSQTAAPSTGVFYLPFDKMAKNVWSDKYHGTASSVYSAPDKRGGADLAYRFTSGNSVVSVANDEALNFTDNLTVSAWVNCEQLGSERFIISHGSWQQRWKLSVTPEGYIRFTVKTDQGTVDLDSPEPLPFNEWHHITGVYSGKALELYLDGGPISFKSQKGLMGTATKDLTIGRADLSETQYAWRGAIDEVKLWNATLSPVQIKELPNLWYTPIGVEEATKKTLTIYPSPTKGLVTIDLGELRGMISLSLNDITGKRVLYKNEMANDNSGFENSLRLNLSEFKPGVYLLLVSDQGGNVYTGKIVLN